MLEDVIESAADLAEHTHFNLFRTVVKTVLVNQTRTVIHSNAVSCK
jgi:hypothetical protein